jgi:hypothetical protein
VRRLLGLTLVATAAGLAAAPSDAGILFAKGTGVPPPVQAFAWRVIESRCQSGQHDIRERSFWAYDARAVRDDGGVVHSIKILSELTWKKTEPPSLIEMTIVDDGGLRLAGLKSSYSACLP